MGNICSKMFVILNILLEIVLHHGIEVPRSNLVPITTKRIGQILEILTRTLAKKIIYHQEKIS